MLLLFWRTRQVTPQTIPLRWNCLVTTSQTLPLGWAGHAAVAAQQALAWSLVGSATGLLPLSYRVFAHLQLAQSAFASDKGAIQAGADADRLSVDQEAILAPDHERATPERTGGLATVKQSSETSDDPEVVMVDVDISLEAKPWPR